LRQELDGVEFPFYSLDPELCWYSGFRWWEGKLRDIAAIIANRKFKGRYLDALRELSQRIAVIELVPYHSIAFKGRRLVGVLPSTAQARDLARLDLVKRASSGRALVIVMRKVAGWRLDAIKCPDVVVYATAQSRSASLSSQSSGGQAILKRFGIKLS
jgi:hypothetical protein